MLFAWSPDSVPGLPSPFTVSISVSVESWASLAALSSPSFVGLPASVDAIVEIELFQVATAVHRSPAHWVEAETSGSLSPPQPAATSARAGDDGCCGCECACHRRSSWAGVWRLDVLLSRDHVTRRAPVALRFDIPSTLRVVERGGLAAR